MATIFEDYKKEIESIYKIKYNKSILDDNDYKRIDEYFNNKLKNNYVPKEIQISNSALQEADEKPKNVDLVKVYDKCRATNCVFSLSHGVYEGADSVVLNIWDGELINRNVYKNKMKEAIKAKDYSQEAFFNRYQRVFKETANKFYGCFGEASFIFHNIDSISNLTGTCYYVLLTSINEIEKVLGGRVLLRNKQELFDYLSYLHNKDISVLDKIDSNHIILRKIKASLNIEEDINYIYNKICSYCTFTLDNSVKDIVKSTISNVFNTNNIGRKIVFKYNCNFKKFLDDTDIFRYMIEKDYNNFISDNYNEKKFIEDNIDERILLELAVYDDFLQADLLDIADNYKRSTVLLSDTDSTFCRAQYLFDYFMNLVSDLSEKHNNKVNDTLDLKTHSFKMVMFINLTMTDYFLSTVGGPKYQNSKDNRWKLKSEFLYNKILLMKVKKTYFGSILSQEGIRLSPLKLDNKNTELVRSRYNHITKEFLKEVFDDLVMIEDKEFDIADTLGILNKYKDKFSEISKDYIKCSRLGNRSDYKITSAYKNDPMSIYTYKAAATFNCLFPEYKSMPGDKTMIMPIKELDVYKEECILNKENLLNELALDDNTKAIINNKFKADSVDLFKFNTFITNENLIDILNSDNYRQVYSRSIYSVIESKKNWLINTYGINNKLKDRLTTLIYKENKNELENNVVNRMIEDMAISYLAFPYYDNMPEEMLDIVDTLSIRLSSIDDRIIRILEALRIKVYQKSDQKNYYTNILKI